MPNATLRSNLSLTKNVKASPVGGNIMTSTVEAAAAAAAGTEYVMLRIPSNARIIGMSEIAFDDLASTGSPTLDIGLKAVNENMTTDDDALNDGIDCAAAAGTAKLIKDAANYGKQAWEFSGESADPGGFFDIIVTIKDAAVNTGGTITATVVYTVD